MNMAVISAVRVDRIAIAPIAVLIGCCLFLIGCEGQGTPPDVPAGRYEAHVDGSISDTLSGPVHYRIQDDKLTGLELGTKEGPGLSIELEPYPPDLRVYEVIEAELLDMERPSSPPGVIAFLDLENATFETTDGMLELTYVSEEEVGASFQFEMEGDFEQGSAMEASVEVTGILNAPKTR